MLDLQHLAVRPHLELAGLLALGDLGVERRPLCARPAALEAEADLHTGGAAVALLGIDRHPAGVAFLVAELVGAGLHHLEIVVARQAGNAVGARHAHLVLGLGVIRLHFLQRNGPVEQVRADHVAVGGARLELMLLDAQRGAGPVDGRAADRLDDPGRQPGEVARDPPASRGRARVEPGDLAEHLPFVIGEIRDLMPSAGFEDHRVDAFQRQLRAERSAAGAGPDHDNDLIVVQIVFRSHVRSSPA